MIIVICCEKGGVGKSSVAQSLAVFLSQERNEDLLLMDADPQGTTLEWVTDREEYNDAPPINCIAAEGNLIPTLEDMRKRYGTILIDTGGSDNKAMRSALAVADKALIPFRPKRRDLKRAPYMADLVEEARLNNPKLEVRSVLTQCPTLPSQQRRIDSGLELLNALELSPIHSWICNRNSWDDSEENGLSVLESGFDEKAAAEARSVFMEFLK